MFSDEVEYRLEGNKRVWFSWDKRVIELMVEGLWKKEKFEIDKSFEKVRKNLSVQQYLSQLFLTLYCKSPEFI